LYQLGIGVEKDLDQAIFWYEKAAEQGSVAAQNNLKQLLPSLN
jgi:TPR repeat protein